MSYENKRNKGKSGSNKEASKARNAKKRSNNSVSYNRKGNKMASDDMRDTRNTGDINDASYYFTTPEVMKQLSSISFNQFAGVPFPLATPSVDQTVDHGEISIPNLMFVRLNPSAGSIDTTTLDNVNNGVNMAARQLFLKLSAGNMKSTEYGPEDVAIAMLGIGNMLESFSFVRRFFGIVSMYNQRNRLVPQKIVEGMGVDFQDLVSGLANYRARFNYIIDLANKIPFFANVPYFHKCATLYDHVYVDSTDNPLSPLYLFTPFSHWKLDDVYSEKGSGLKTVLWPEPNGSGNVEFGALLGLLENQVLALVNSTALLKVYSDVLRLIDKENYTRLQLAPIPTDYGILPVYSDEVKWMIRNCTIIGTPTPLDKIPSDIEWDGAYSATNNNDVKANVEDSVVDYYPVFHTTFPSTTSTLASIMNESLLTMPDQNYTVDQFVESTRLITHADGWFTSEDPEAPYYGYTTHVSLPDHYVVSIVVDTLYPSSVTGRNDGLLNINTVTLKAATRTIPSIAAADKFDCAPFIYLFEADSAVDDYIDVIGDLKWYTTINYKLTRTVNDFAMLGLLTSR